jgi:hypothetical protein
LTVSIATTKSQLDKALAGSEDAVRLKVTGIDVKGQMFRHAATVLMLDGRDCAFRSKSQPELEGSVLVEFDYPEANPQRRLSQARVKSTRTELETDSFLVVVELEVAQTMKVFSSQSEPQAAIKKPAPLPIPSSTPAPLAGKAGPIIAPRELSPPPKTDSIAPTLPVANLASSPRVHSDSREPLDKVQSENPIAVREAVKSAVASEIKQEINLLRNWISSELERSLPTIVSAKMESMVQESVEKQISLNCETSMQALNVKVARQVEEKITEIQALRALVEGIAKTLTEELIGISGTAERKFEQKLNARAVAIIESFAEPLAEAEARIKSARADMETVLTQAQNLKQEFNESVLPLRKAMEQWKNVETAGMEKFQSQAAAQLSTCAVQFENQLNKIATERATQFSMEMEKQQALHQQRADETVEKLGAMLQLLHGTAKAQQERLTKHLQTTLASLEKEIRAILLRIAGGA